MKWLSKFKFSLPPLPTPPPAHTPQRSTLLLLGLVVAVPTFLHFLLGHPIIASFGVLVWAMKLVSIMRRNMMPPRWLVMLLTISSFLLVLIFYGGWNGQKAGISFLVLLASLKFLESRILRDYYMVCLILFFLASSSFLFNSSLQNIFAVLAYTTLVLSLMLKLADPEKSKSILPLSASTGILVKALPLAVLLFFFFPRIHGSFGFIPSQDDAQSGGKVNDSMVAGDFVNSAFSNEPAFRVEFDGSIPANAQLYWRLKVMEDERNFAWEVRRPSRNALELAQGLQDRRKSTASAEAEETVISYQIVHEPSRDNYAPYLDYAFNPDSGLQLQDYSVYRTRPESGVFAYNGAATFTPNLDEDSVNRVKLLSTLSRPSARSLTLLDRWRRNAKTDTELVNQVMQFYRDNNFAYTLSPPGLGDNALDSFLFETRAGYCEHYASSFTILMRWLGIPARVVVGFQGGARNQVGNYLQVKYSDAHAWSEVWLDGRWYRVDPTSASALGEQRLEQGMDALISLWENGEWDTWQDGSSLADYMNPGGVQRALQRLRDTWDNMGYQWNKWVVNYDFAAQSKLLSNLGFEHRNSLYTLLGILLASTLGLMLFYFWQLIPKAVKIEAAQQQYLKFLARCKKLGLEKALSETPNQFAEKAIQLSPDYAVQINSITKAYVDLRFGRNPGSVDALQDLVAEFRPRRVNARSN
jgi:transglutaminase-like putative cysteine protease